MSVEGLEELGRGDDAIVYQLGDMNLAARIAISSKPFDRFVALSKTFVSPHLPQFHYHKNNSHISLTIMEKLESSPDNSESAFWADANETASLAYARLDERPYDRRLREGSLYRIAIELGDRAREYNYALDLNRENILRRQARVIVFTDAWCNWGE